MTFGQTSLAQLIRPAKLRRAGNTAYPILSMTMHSGLVDQSNKFKKRVASIDTSQYRVVTRSQLIVGFPIDEGVLSFQRLYDEAIVSPAYDVWDLVDEHSIEPRYLERFLRSPSALKFYGSKLRGTTARRRTLPDDIFLSLSVPVPPIAEQTRIVEILERADALLMSRRATMATQVDLIHSLLEQYMSSADVTLRSIGELLENGDLLLHKDGNHGGSYPRAEEFGDSGVPFITAKSITDDGRLKDDLVPWLNDRRAAELKIGWLSAGDVLLAHNASVGKVAIYDGRWPRALIGTSLTAFRPNPSRMDSQFLAGALKSRTLQQQLKRNMSQTTRNQVPITAQRSLLLPVLPLELQRQLSEYMRAGEGINHAQSESLDVIQELRSSLQHRAFRGEL